MKPVGPARTTRLRRIAYDAPAPPGVGWTRLSPRLRNPVTHARSFAFHHESHVTLRTSVHTAFEYLDDFRKLSAHMERPSAMMLGSRMEIVTDEGGGRAVGSRVRMSGQVIGIPLLLEEVVVERAPPSRKAWETLDARLLVIGQYRLGFELEPRGGACALRVFIDYDWPRGLVT